MSKYEQVIQGLKHVPASIGIKALEKLDPRFKNFFTSALSYGLDANRAFDYLIDRFGGGKPEQNFQSKQLRPDEQVAKNEIEASGIPARLVKSGAALGLGALGAGARLGGAAAGAASEALNSQTQPSGESYGPETQAKEISGRVSQLAQNTREAQQNAKINPTNIGNLAKNIPGMARKGVDKAQAAFSTSNIPSGSGVETFIAKFPELGRFLDEKINQGVSPLQAATEAKGVKKFQPQIEEIETDMEQPFEQLVSYLFQGTDKFSETSPKKQGVSQALQMLSQLASELKGRRG